MSATATLLRPSARLYLRSIVRRPTTIPTLSALSRWYASKGKQDTPSKSYRQKLTRHSDFPPHSVVSMPALSPTMTSGNIGAWQKKVGDSLSPGDVLVEIETDKAQMDFEFQDEGVLAKVLKDSGEKDVAVGNVRLYRVLFLGLVLDANVAFIAHRRYGGRRRRRVGFRLIHSRRCRW